MGIKAQVLIEMDSQQFKTFIAFIIDAFDRFNQFSVYLLTKFITVKGTVSREFLLLVFFMNQFTPGPRVLRLDRFEFFRKFAEIIASQGAPPVSTTPVANLPPVSAHWSPQL